MANSADPDQLASSEANWSGATLFANAGQGLTTFALPESGLISGVVLILNVEHSSR